MIDIVAEFSNHWRFELSPEKSEVMVVGGKAFEQGWSMNNAPLEVANSFKHLGVEFQDNGRWKDVYDRLRGTAKHRVDPLDWCWDAGIWFFSRYC